MFQGTSECLCKDNVEDGRCDTCKEGFFNLQVTGDLIIVLQRANRFISMFAFLVKSPLFVTLFLQKYNFTKVMEHLCPTNKYLNRV